MKVINKSENIEVEFKSIKVGSAFYYPRSGGMYMRTEDVFDDNADVIVNAVNLRLGSLCMFPSDHKVIAIDCECIISDK